MIETEKTNYGNWIPRTFMTLCYSTVALLLAIELGLFFASVGTAVSVSYTHLTLPTNSRV